MSDSLRAVELTQPHCDYFDCTNRPTVTDGDWVMCTHHEARAYRTSTYWRPIVAIVTNLAGRYPVLRAEYRLH
ncbi:MULTISPECIES: hypothetical protein [Gordonia]|uniref:hypothetical protein n=1 Tax=Gordonia TaxID=2053 RepID=UPI0002F1FBFA|nr:MULTISPECIES: hypothetical protein [Gordonia]MCZ4581601.1 hypothetical protein [Gordonia amicalis]